MIDWQRVFLNLRASGLSLAAAAKDIGMEPRAANDYARGVRWRDPPLGQALRVLDLHQQRCPAKHSPREIGKP